MKRSKTSRYDRAYIKVAEIFAGLSHDTRIKVGCCIVKDGQILSQGWNGMPSGMNNDTRDLNGYTNKEVIHAETNALTKLAKNGGNANGATIYCTHSPCYNCSLLLLQSGITRVCYAKVYDTKAIAFLQERGLQIECIDGATRVSP